MLILINLKLCHGLFIFSFAPGHLFCNSTYAIIHISASSSLYERPQTVHMYLISMQSALRLFVHKSDDEQMFSACTALKYNLSFQVVGFMHASNYARHIILLQRDEIKSTRR